MAKSLFFLVLLFAICLALPAFAEFKFAAYGDSRTGVDIHSDIVDMILDEEASFVIHTGDFVGSGDDWSQWQSQFIDIAGPLLYHEPSPGLTTFFYPSIGNHETSGTGWSTNYFNVFNVDPINQYYYSFDYQNAHFVSLYVTSTWRPSDFDPSSAQYQWLSNDLAQASADPNIKWKFVFFHAPVFSCVATHACGKYIQEHLVPLFDQYDVTAVFGGDDHSYQRIGPIKDYQIDPVGTSYIITAGGGASLYSFYSTTNCNLHEGRTDMPCDPSWTGLPHQAFPLEAGESVNHYMRFTVRDNAVVGEAIRRDGTIIETFNLQNEVVVVDPVCVNNIREGTEVCDGTDLGGESCQSQGFDSGDLTCLPDCSGFDTSQCAAQTFYVDKENAGCADSKPGTETEPWCTLTKAAATAQAGDTVLIKAGEYNEVLKPVNSGTPGSPITFKAFGNGEVVIDGVNSVDNDEEYGPLWLDQKDYIIIDGFTVKNSIGYLRAIRSNHNTIRNGTFLDATGSGRRAGLYFFESNYNRVLDNTIKGGSDNLSFIHSNGNILQGNRFEKARHALWVIKCGNNNIVRKNYFYNPWQKIGEIYDCETPTMDWYGHGQFSQNNPILNSTKYNLVEDNDFAYTSSSGNRSPYAGIQYAGQYGIIRKNRFYDTVGPGLSLTYYPTEAMYNYGNRVYNNVFYSTDFAGVSISGTTSADFDDQVLKNNILAKSIFVANDKRWCWYLQELAGKPVQLMIRTRDGEAPALLAAKFFVENNNFFNTQSGENNTITTGSRWKKPSIQVDCSAALEPPEDPPNPAPHNLAWWQSNRQDLFKSNIEFEPMFVNPNAHDFNLQGNSPMIDAGAFLTKTVSGGSNSVAMVVEDAGYFFDGFGIPGETGDVIQLEGQTQTATITSIDYTNNTLTLSNPLTWTTGRGVSLAYSGNAPDLGAIEFTDSGTTCANTDTSCGTYPTCTNCNSQDGCSENTYRNYYCSGNTCSYTEDNCTDCSCSCGGYNTTESIANNNCADGKDNDCDSLTDAADTGCEQPQTCGNGQIDDEENCENCPQDVPCTTGEICCAAACITPECTQDTDCLTEQHCTNQGTCNAACTDCNITCSTDTECDDQDPETIDTCINQGTCESFCRNEPVTCGGQTCSTGQICCNQTCTIPECNSSTECNDQDQCTRDYCSQAGTCNAQCTHTEIQKCGWKNMTWVLPSCFPIDRPFEITIKDEAGNPLQGVTIEYGTQTETTDASGKTELIGEKAKYLINATKDSYHPLNGKKIATTTCNPTYTTGNGKPPTTGKEKINIEIIDTPYIGREFTLKITDKDGNPIEGATVEYSKQTVTTDQTGQAELQGEKAKYLITATAPQGKETTKILPKTYTETGDQNVSGDGTTEQPLALPLDIIALVIIIIVGGFALLRAKAPKKGSSK